MNRNFLTCLTRIKVERIQKRSRAQIRRRTTWPHPRIRLTLSRWASSQSLLRQNPAWASIVKGLVQMNGGIRNRQLIKVETISMDQANILAKQPGAHQYKNSKVFSTVKDYSSLAGKLRTPTHRVQKTKEVDEQISIRYRLSGITI